MSWQRVRKKRQNLLVRFVQEHELRCVPFASRLRETEGKNAVFIEREGRDSIRAAVMITEYGLVLPVFGVQQDSRPDNGFRNILRRRSPKIFSVMGVAKDVLRTEDYLTPGPSTSIDYFLMCLQRDAFRGPCSGTCSEISVRCVTEADAEALFPLQRDYEIEEVVLRPRDFNASRSMALFRRALTRNIVYVVEKNGLPVSKAGTNERGYATDQLGGVFTKREERRKGFARTVMEHLLQRVFKDKSAVSLFVKKHNQAALDLYRNLGFTVRDDYRIDYYFR